LINDVHLIEFEQYKIKIRHTKSVPYNFANKVAAFLQEWTGNKWNIFVSSEGDEGAPTLHTQAENFKTKQMDEYNQHNAVQEVLKNFTSAKINNVLKK
jgi:DNA polymerase-3 subunit gamma/tau